MRSHERVASRICVFAAVFLVLSFLRIDVSCALLLYCLIGLCHAQLEKLTGSQADGQTLYISTFQVYFMAIISQSEQIYVLSKAYLAVPGTEGR